MAVKSNYGRRPADLAWHMVSLADISSDSLHLQIVSRSGS